MVSAHESGGDPRGWDHLKRRSHTTVTAVAAVIGALLAFASAAPVAHAGCGGVETAGARRDANPGGRAPLAIGDSTMLLALPNLSREGYKVNAHGCRQLEEGLRVIRDAKRHGRLPHLTVLALGADGELTAGKLEEAFHLIGPRRVLGLVTPLELGGWAGHDATLVRHEARRHPARTVLLDWVRYSRGHPSWFQPDELHLTFSGAHAFARLLRQALVYARPGHPVTPP